MNQQLSRRQFGKMAGALTVAGLAPSAALGANERIQMGVIGVGGMGSGHLGGLVNRRDADTVRVVAVCDVYRRRLERAMAACSGEGAMDYRQILDRKDVDAVLIATPDHWHGKIAIDALEAGKHVYVEKPMT